jgi:hypothetical protein
MVADELNVPAFKKVLFVYLPPSWAMPLASTWKRSTTGFGDA